MTRFTRLRSGWRVLPVVMVALRLLQFGDAVVIAAVAADGAGSAVVAAAEDQGLASAVGAGGEPGGASGAVLGIDEPWWCVGGENSRLGGHASCSFRRQSWLSGLQWLRTGQASQCAGVGACGSGITMRGLGVARCSRSCWTLRRIGCKSPVTGCGRRDSGRWWWGCGVLAGLARRGYRAWRSRRLRRECGGDRGCGDRREFRRGI